MKDSLYASVMHDLSRIHMTEHDRARAEGGVRVSATLIGLIAGMFTRSAALAQPRA